MAGPMFRELAEDLAPLYPEGCVLVTGHPDTLAKRLVVTPNLTIKMAPTYNRTSKFQRVYSWLSYTLVASRYILLSGQDDAILLVSNPPILGAWVWLLTRFKKTPYAVLVYDIHPDVLIRLGVLNPNSWMVKLWNAANRKVYESANLTITIGQRMAGLLNKQKSTKTKHVVTVTPWVDVNKMKPIKRTENPYINKFLSVKDEFVVLYSGNMGASHDIDSILMSALVLKNQTSIKFIFIGEGDKYNDIDKFIQIHQLSNISLFPFQPESMIKYSMAIADVSLVSLDQGMEDLMVPSKSFYYLAVGSALIAITNDKSELSDLLHSNYCGIIVPPGQPDILAESILNLASSPQDLALMKKNARELAEKKYSRHACTLEFSEFLRQSGLL